MSKALKKVVVVPIQTLEVVEGMAVNTKKHVSAYCRVSTDSLEQLSSYEAQVTYYSNGTNTKHRLEFHRMIKDALDGKMDLIITKSISRFARNTEDCLKYVRQLKNKGVAVYFELHDYPDPDQRKILWCTTGAEDRNGRLSHA